MILRDKHCIFFHIAKTAGTAVERWLDPIGYRYDVASREAMLGYDPDEGIVLQHAPPAMFRRLVGAALFDRCFRFTVVRNPYARILSAYFYRMEAERYDSFESCLKHLLSLPRDPAATKSWEHVYFLPQTCYTHLDGRPCCHAILRFEELPHGLKPVGERLGITRMLRTFNENVRTGTERARRPVASFYTPSTARMVVDLCGADFETFGYSTDLAAIAA